MAKCKHNVKMFDVLGEMVCIECVLVRLSSPLREYSRHLVELEQEDALQAVKERFNLDNRDIILMGYVWGEWQKRNG